MAGTTLDATRRPTSGSSIRVGSRCGDHPDHWRQLPAPEPTIDPNRTDYRNQRPATGDQDRCGGRPREPGDRAGLKRSEPMALNFPVTPSFVHNKGRGDAGGLVSIQSEAVMAGLSRSEHLGKAPLLICVFAAAVVGMLTFGAFHALAQDAGQSGG